MPLSMHLHFPTASMRLIFLPCIVLVFLPSAAAPSGRWGGPYHTKLLVVVLKMLLVTHPAQVTPPDSLAEQGFLPWVGRALSVTPARLTGADRGTHRAAYVCRLILRRMR